MFTTEMEKQLLIHLFSLIGTNASSVASLRAAKNRFSDWDSASFWMTCSNLIEKQILINTVMDDVSFSPEGWRLAHDLMDSPCAKETGMNEHLGHPQKIIADDDLRWDISGFAHAIAVEKLMIKCSKELCIYSVKTRTLYTNYNVLLPTGSRSILIRPDRHALHEIIRNVPEESISETNFYVALDKECHIGLVISVEGCHPVTLPLDAGLKNLQRRRGQKVPLLPVITREGLQEITPAIPALKLQLINLETIKKSSEETAFKIRRVIQDHLIQKFQPASQNQAM